VAFKNLGTGTYDLIEYAKRWLIAIFSTFKDTLGVYLGTCPCKPTSSAGAAVNANKNIVSIRKIENLRFIKGNLVL
jgi:hypothetical protein